MFFGAAFEKGRAVTTADMASDERTVFVRLRRFLRRPWNEKVQSLRFRWVRTFPKVPLPVRLPFGAWWLAQDDFLGGAILSGGFEDAEYHFVQSFLQPGMTVLDVGAHHGFYTLLASRKVGPSGRVLAFEPSPRERRRLRQHLRLNRCRNVCVEAFALGASPGEAELFLVRGSQTGCNSLRPPQVAEPTETLRVLVETLDRLLQRQQIERVDFIKMDVEGAEWGVLQGAAQLLGRRPRPVVLCEVQDIRTQPWGYRAKEIVLFLARLGYRWFLPMPDGNLEGISSDQDGFDSNLVAVPDERALETCSRCRGVGRTGYRA